MRGKWRAGECVGQGRSVAARRIKTDSEKMEENGVCKPMDLCRKDKWREESDARGNVPGE